MLALTSPRWETLSDAYGSAANIPQLLRQLEKAPPYEDYQTEPYFSLWSGLYHQNDIYTGSYAALPHLANACRANPSSTAWTVLHLMVRIEFARLKLWGPPMPEDLEAAYFSAIADLPQIAIDMLHDQKDPSLTVIAAAGLAVAKGDVPLAEAIMELEGETIDAFLDWVKAR